MTSEIYLVYSLQGWYLCIVISKVGNYHIVNVSHNNSNKYKKKLKICKCVKNNRIKIHTYTDKIYTTGIS